jgi:hypothetical protein
MTDSAACPQCDYRWPDAYTHGDCPPGSTPDDHQHWVCANRACQHEWAESVVAVAVLPGGVGS